MELKSQAGGIIVSKAHRGKGIRENYNRGRGTCPVCKKTGVKIVYEQEIDGVKQNICKICKATIKNEKAKAATTAPTPTSTEPASTEDNAVAETAVEE